MTALGGEFFSPQSQTFRDHFRPTPRRRSAPYAKISKTSFEKFLKHLSKNFRNIFRNISKTSSEKFPNPPPERFPNTPRKILREVPRERFPTNAMGRNKMELTNPANVKPEFSELGQKYINNEITKTMLLNNKDFYNDVLGKGFDIRFFEESFKRRK